MAETLKEHLKRTSTYVYLQPEETMEAVYKGWKEATGKFGQTIHYTLDMPEGEKIWDCKNRGVETQMSDLKPPVKIRIKRSKKDAAGKTVYEITTL